MFMVNGNLGSRSPILRMMKARTARYVQKVRLLRRRSERSDNMNRFTCGIFAVILFFAVTFLPITCGEPLEATPTDLSENVRLSITWVNQQENLGYGSIIILRANIEGLELPYRIYWEEYDGEEWHECGQGLELQFEINEVNVGHTFRFYIEID